MATVQICVFNPVTTFIDQVTAAVFGPGVSGQPVVLNAQGYIDQSLLGQGVTVTVATNLSPGNLVNLYSQGGTLHAQLAYAASGGTAPSGATYPIPANGFVSSQLFAGGTGGVAFSGTFVYIDGNSEFHASDIGKIVFLSAISPGGVTLTAPTIPVGVLAQSVGYVVAFTAPNLVTVAFSPAFLDFTQVNGVLPISKGGTGFTTAPAALISLIGGSPSIGDSLVWNGTAWVSSTFPAIEGTIATGQIAVGSGTDTISGSSALTFSGGGFTVNATDFVTINNSGSGGTSITDIGGGGIAITDGQGSPPINGGGVNINSYGVGGYIILDNSGPGSTGGIELIDNSLGGISISAESLTGAIALLNSGSPSPYAPGIVIANTGTTGISIEDSGGYGIKIAASGTGLGVVGMALSNSAVGSDGTTIMDTSGGDMLITLTSGSAPAHLTIANTGISAGTTLEDLGGGGLNLTSNGGLTIRNDTANGLTILDDSGDGILIESTGVGGNVNITTVGAFKLTAFSGTAHPILLPTTTGAAGQALVTNGANPQQTSWVTVPSVSSPITAGEIAFGSGTNTLEGSANLTYAPAGSGSPPLAGGLLTINGSGFPGNVIELTNTGGVNTHPTFISQSNGDAFAITTGLSSLGLSPAGNASFRGGSGNIGLEIQGNNVLYLNGADTGTILFNEGGAGFGGGSNQIEIDLYRTGAGPHGVWFKDDAGTQSLFWSNDTGNLILKSATAVGDVLTQVSISGSPPSVVTYFGTITDGGSNVLAGKLVTITGFANAGNNVTAVITGSSGTYITVAYTTQVNETHAGLTVLNWNPAITLEGSWWNGSAAVLDSTTIQNVIGTTETPTSVLTISNTGAYAWGGVAINAGPLTLNGSTSGGATLQVAAIAGTPNPLQLPITTGTAGQVLTTDGGNPQQLSWQTPAADNDSFSVISSGTNTTATMTVGPGATLTFSGAGSPPTEGEINANFLYGVQIEPYAPTAGQVLTALSATNAQWQTPALTQTVRVAYASNPLASGALSSAITVNFATPFADGNYTVSVDAEVAEALSGATVVTTFKKQATPGNGVTVWVLNNDSISHNVTVHVIARHD